MVGIPEVKRQGRGGRSNFRLARQPPTIVTWAEPHFYDLPLIRPSGFVNSDGRAFPIKNWADCAWIAVGMATIGSYPVSVSHTESTCYPAQESEILRL